MYEVLSHSYPDGSYSQADYDAYHAALPEYTEMLETAKGLEGAERYLAFAQLEAYLLESGVVKPTVTQGGNYAATRIQPRTVPYTLYGTDNEKLKHLIIHEDILTNVEIVGYKALWQAERAKRYAKPSEYYGEHYAL